tara:strand:- start:217 stop:426 length:210 start_codon:yes stop_codon:yes gene_type:complete
MILFKQPETVIKAIDFTLYSCSGITCFLAYLNHYATPIALGIAFCSLLVSIIYKHLNYKLQKKQLDIDT